MQCDGWKWSCCRSNVTMITTHNSVFEGTVVSECIEMLVRNLELSASVAFLFISGCKTESLTVQESVVRLPAAIVFHGRDERKSV